jgi:hypothetical protein
VLTAGPERLHVPSFDWSAIHQLTIFKIRKVATDLHQVLADHSMSGVRNPGGKITVVGEQKQALGMVVETTYREETLLHRRSHEVEYRSPLFGVITRCHYFARFVEQDVAQSFG